MVLCHAFQPEDSNFIEFSTLKEKKNTSYVFGQWELIFWTLYLIKSAHHLSNSMDSLKPSGLAISFTCVVPGTDFSKPQHRAF